jgi:glycosyltransferase involved in cell wall biosynthesis
VRVLHVNDYPVEAGGGAEVLLARTLALLRAAGVEAGVFTSADLPDARLSARRYVDNPVARRALRHTLHAFRPDVVHLHNFYHVLSPGILAELARAKRSRPLRVVMTAHDYHLVCPNAGGNFFRPADECPRPVEPGRLASLAYLLGHRWDQRGIGHSGLKLAQHMINYRLLGRHGVIDLVVCPSEFLARLVRRVAGATCVLPHPAPAVAPAGARDGELRLVFVGRLEPEKGLAAFLDMLPPAFGGALTVVGDGGERARCEAICRRRGLEARVAFRGRLAHNQALAEIARAHVVVLPSRCLESYGLTLIEALAAGTNVLSSDRGAMRELIETAGAGYLFNPEDPASLADRLAAIEQAHRAGTLNTFDVAVFLRERSEAAYVRRLLQIYRGEDA